MRNVLIVLILTALATPSSGMTFVTLDKDGQGKGNKGTNFRPVDAMGDLANFELTARSSVDTLQPSVADAPGPFGTVFVDDDGTGVQNASPADQRGSRAKVQMTTKS